MEKRSEQLMCGIIISQYQQTRRIDESISEKKLSLQLISPELSFFVMTTVLQNLILVKSQPTPWRSGR